MFNEFFIYKIPQVRRKCSDETLQFIIDELSKPWQENGGGLKLELQNPRQESQQGNYYIIIAVSFSFFDLLSAFLFDKISEIAGLIVQLFSERLSIGHVWAGFRLLGKDLLQAPLPKPCIGYMTHQKPPPLPDKRFKLHTLKL